MGTNLILGPLTVFAGAVILATSGCGTSCQDIVAQYINAQPYAKSCDPTAPAPCSGQLPSAESMLNTNHTNGGSTPEYLAGNCNTSYNPARLDNLQALVSQYQSDGCTFGIVPICGDASTAQCIAIPVDEGGDGGYTCVDGS